MGTYNPDYKSTSSLLRGLRGLISTVIIGVRSTLNLQVSLRNSQPYQERAPDSARNELQTSGRCSALGATASFETRFRLRPGLRGNSKRLPGLSDLCSNCTYPKP